MLPSGDGYGYRILFDGVVKIIQPFQPAVDGEQKMNRTQAINLSNLVVEKLQNLPTEEELAELNALGLKIRGEQELTESEMERFFILSNKGNPALSVDEVTSICGG